MDNLGTLAGKFTGYLEVDILKICSFYGWESKKEVPLFNVKLATEEKSVMPNFETAGLILMLSDIAKYRYSYLKNVLGFDTVRTTSFFYYNSEKEIVNRFVAETLKAYGGPVFTSDHPLLAKLLEENNFWITIEIAEISSLKSLFYWLSIWEKERKYGPLLSEPGVLEMIRLTKLLHERGTISELPEYVSKLESH
jgi:hypothetical protein